MDPITPGQVQAGVERIAGHLMSCRRRHPQRSKKTPPLAVDRLQDLFAEVLLLRRFGQLWAGEYLSDRQLTPLERHGQPTDWPATDAGAVRAALLSLTHDYQLVSCDRRRDGTNRYGVRKSKAELLWRLLCALREAEIERLKLEPWLRRRKVAR